MLINIEKQSCIFCNQRWRLEVSAFQDNGQQETAFRQQKLFPYQMTSCCSIRAKLKCLPLIKQITIAATVFYVLRIQRQKVPHL